MEGLLGTEFVTEILITIWYECCLSGLLARAQKLESPCSEFPVLTFSFHQVWSPHWDVYLMWCWIWVWWNSVPFPSWAPLVPPVCRGLLFQLTFENLSLWLLWIARILKTVSGCDQRLTCGLWKRDIVQVWFNICRAGSVKQTIFRDGSSRDLYELSPTCGALSVCCSFLYLYKMWRRNYKWNGFWIQIPYLEISNNDTFAANILTSPLTSCPFSAQTLELSRRCREKMVSSIKISILSLWAAAPHGKGEG